MPLQKLRNFLDEQGVRYVLIVHSPAYTAQEIAASAHIPGKKLAKTVMAKVDGKMSMFVLPATYQLDLSKCKAEMNAKEVELASEEEFKYLFPECEIGAMPPFGNLYGLPVYACKELAENDEIAFNAGNHRELIKLPFADFQRLVNPMIIDITKEM
ncbi:YbaK/prolyl-tRNA synthetase associated region [Caldithrix abyssi DSM 13497]|uniref:Ala-tRNA(Pro) deacylase n=1 Tax=Caldithrix abyssi DSM 13497 TaxID=880073 RepID=H1XQS4_CALAY|nr:YbaK/EbsC family protein [Caldithrix abyssi]APF18333.1 Ala-tRNA(Pro) deacylase [Caldithrix abyssi DSM 13497]EHO42347.1 YbaK/prolyl-tRNA synthetase associated region [Caldithrix abyssi DSM 13497]